MATLLERADIAHAPNFIARVQQGLVQVAAEITDEDSGTALHDERLDLAHKILTGALGPTALAGIVAQRVVLNENIGTANGADQETETGDGNLLFILRDTYNDYIEP